MAIKKKVTRTIVCLLIERVFSVSVRPETSHSDQGQEFENELVKELQSVFCYIRKRVQQLSVLKAALFYGRAQHCPQYVGYV